MRVSIAKEVVAGRGEQRDGVGYWGFRDLPVLPEKHLWRGCKKFP